MGLTWAQFGVTLGLNALIAGVYLLLYSLFALQPANARVYFTRWFVLDEEAAGRVHEGGVELHVRRYLHALDWMPRALRFPEEQLLVHAGIDAAVHLRMFRLALMMFAPAAAVLCAILIPVYATSSYLATLQHNPNYAISSLDYLSLANVPPKSGLLWLPAVLAWGFTLWALVLMRQEFRTICQLRLQYLATMPQAANQYTVLVRDVPANTSAAVPEEAARFFANLYGPAYLRTQEIYDATKAEAMNVKRDSLANKLEKARIKLQKKLVRPVARAKVCGPKEDAIDLYQAQLRDLDAKTQQTVNNLKWVTRAAPEPRDVYWGNLTMHSWTIPLRRLVAGAVVFVVVVFYTIPVAAVQGLANLNSIEKAAPWLQPVIQIPFVNAVLQGFLPGLALSLFLLILPPLLRVLSRFEGYEAKSSIERAAAGKYFYFMWVSVFISNVLAGSTFGNIKYFSSNPTQIPSALGAQVPAKAVFFITFILINGWVGIATELFRMVPLILFHIKNALLVATPRDRYKAMGPSPPDYVQMVPQMELYFLLTFVYIIIAPFFLPFVLIFFAGGYLIYKNQFVNVYSAEYELLGGYWPHFHQRSIFSLVLAHVVLIGVLALKQSIGPAIFCVPLPFLALIFNHTFVQLPYSNPFKAMPLYEAKSRDDEDAEHFGAEPLEFLEGAYLHPCLKMESKDPETGAGDNTQLAAPTLHSSGPERHSGEGDEGSETDSFVSQGSTEATKKGD